MKLELKKILENPLVSKFKVFVMPAVAIIICLLLFVFIVGPQVVSTFQATNAAKEADAKIKLLNNKINQLEQIDENAYKQDIETALIAIPTEKDIAVAIGQVQTLLSSNNLQLDAMSFGVNPPEGKTQSFLVKVDVSGNVQSLKDFTAKVKNYPRLFKVSSVNISNNSGTKVQAGIILIAYFQEVQNKIGDVDQPLTLPTDKDREILASIRESAKVFTGVTQNTLAVKSGKSDPFQ